MALLERILESPAVEVKRWCVAPGFPLAAHGIEFFVGEYSVQLQENFSFFRGYYLSIGDRALGGVVGAKVQATIQQLKEKELRNLRNKAQAVSELSKYELRSFMSTEKTNKSTAACCSKRAARITREAGWFGSALVAKFEEKFLQDGNDLLGFSGGKDDGVVFSLVDYDVSFFVDFDFCPVAWGDGVGGHAYTVSFKVRGGKVISYEVRGRGKYEVFVKILPQGRDVKNS